MTREEMKSRGEDEKMMDAPEINNNPKPEESFNVNYLRIYYGKSSQIFIFFFFFASQISLKLLSDESFQNVSKLSFKISLARPALKFNEEAVLALYSGDVKCASGLQAYLLSRDYSNLKSEFQEGNGKITVSCIEKLPVVTVVLGDHLHLTVGDSTC